MIHYHGLPMTPVLAMLRAMKGRHATHEAAPDLLAALRDCADYLQASVDEGADDDSTPFLAAALAAIAKAGRRR